MSLVWPKASDLEKHFPTFIGAVEIAVQQVRRARAPGAVTSGPAVPPVPGDVEQAVRAAYAASVAAGRPLSQRVMAERFGGVPPQGQPARGNRCRRG